MSERKEPTVFSRELDPFKTHYVICKEVYISGFKLEFGDPITDACHLGLVHTHFYNGAIGTQEELEALGGVPVELIDPSNSLMPEAVFVRDPHRDRAPLENLDESTEEKFSLVALNQLAEIRVKDMVDYAKAFDIEVKSAGKKKADVRDLIIEEAKAKGLIPE